MNTDDRMHYEFEFTNPAITPGLAVAEAVSVCPMGWAITDVTFSDWVFESTEITQFDGGGEIQRSKIGRWVTAVRVTAVKND